MKRILLALCAASLVWMASPAVAQDAGTTKLNKSADMTGRDCESLSSSNRTCYYQFLTAVHSAAFRVAPNTTVHVKFDTDDAAATDSGAEIKIHVVVSGETNIGSYVPSDATMDDTANLKTYVLQSGTYYIEASSAPGGGETALVKFEVVDD